MWPTFKDEEKEMMNAIIALSLLSDFGIFSNRAIIDQALKIIVENYQEVFDENFSLSSLLPR